MWSRAALSAYTWMRTKKGPQRQWLHHINKADNNSCPCDDNTAQSGHHPTFTCCLHSAARSELIGDRHTWEDLDLPHIITIGDDEVDGVMLFFEYIFDQLT